MPDAGPLLFCPPPRADLVRPTVTRARRLLRAFLMATVPGVVGSAVAFLGALIVMAHKDPENYSSMAAFHNAEYTAGGQVIVGVLVALIALKLAAFAYVAPKVSYRRRDVLLLFVPCYGALVYFTVLYRVADVSARDWPIRVDEIPSTWFVPIDAGARY